MKKLFIFISISFVLQLHAQPPSTIAFTFNHIALSVNHVDSAAIFYKQILGLQEITNRTKVNGIRWFSLGENKELHLISVVPQKVVINKAIHVAITTPQFNSFVQWLQQQRIAYYSWNEEKNTITTRADGTLQVYLKDPDGYWVEINSVGK
jgi:lactoylglutathione lyase